MKKKNIGVFIGIFIFIIIAGGYVGIQQIKKLTKPPEQTETKKKKITEPLNVIEVSKRPYILLKPTSDNHNIIITIEEVKIPSNIMDFELIYQSGDVVQGFFDSISFDKTPAQKKFLLGSCSSGGKCTYHTNISTGTLTARFSGKETYALKQNFSYFDSDRLNNLKDKKIFSTKDMKFEIGSEDLAGNIPFIIYESPGYPKLPKQIKDDSIVSGIYTIGTVNPLQGKAKVYIKVNNNPSDVKIVGYDGSNWHYFDAKLENGVASADVDLMQTYFVIKK